MARFRCIAVDCTVITGRRRAPAGCPDSNRCEFEEYDGEDPVALPAPPPPPAPEPEPAVPLRMEVGGRAWTVTGAVVLGRNGDIASESLREHLSVSRRHCKLSRAGGEWRIEALSEASPTVLDGQTIPVGSQMVMAGPSHELVLGGSMRIRLELSAATPPPFTGALDELLGGKVE